MTRPGPAIRSSQDAGPPLYLVAVDAPRPSWLRSAAPSHPDTALRLTAIALLLRPMGQWFVRPAILGAAALLLISPRALRMPAIWLGLAFAVAVRMADDWPLADNHIYLLAYWCSRLRCRCVRRSRWRREGRSIRHAAVVSSTRMPQVDSAADVLSRHVRVCASRGIRLAAARDGRGADWAGWLLDVSGRSSNNAVSI
ncbi:MAG: hypothetical protein ACM4AI_06735 [Acidobacteriota bacterium]